MLTLFITLHSWIKHVLRGPTLLLQLAHKEICHVSLSVVNIQQFLMKRHQNNSLTKITKVNTKMSQISLIVFQSLKSRIGSDLFTVIFFLIQQFGVEELSKYRMDYGTLLYFSRMARLYFSVETTRVNVYFQSLKSYQLSRYHAVDNIQQFYTRTGRSYSSARMTKDSVL